MHKIYIYLKYGYFLNVKHVAQPLPNIYQQKTNSENKSELVFLLS